MVLDYVRNGDIQSEVPVAWGTRASYANAFSPLSRKVWKPSPLAKVEDQAALIRGLVYEAQTGDGQYRHQPDDCI